MTTYVALLRGINVGGHNKVPMAELRELFAALGHRGARTYIQSGNVVFDAEADAGTLEREIKAGIAKRFGFDVPVMVRSRAELDMVLAAHPFGDRELDPAKVAVVFLSGPIGEVTVADGYPEEAVSAGRELFIHYPDGMGRSKLDRSGFWKQLGDVTTTTRNWRTVTMLRQLMDG